MPPPPVQQPWRWSALFGRHLPTLPKWENHHNWIYTAGGAAIGVAIGLFSLWITWRTPSLSKDDVKEVVDRKGDEIIRYLPSPPLPLSPPIPIVVPPMPPPPANLAQSESDARLAALRQAATLWHSRKGPDYDDFLASTNETPVLVRISRHTENGSAGSPRKSAGKCLTPYLRC
jgi:hypothetical protein